MPARKLPAVDLSTVRERPRCQEIIAAPEAGWAQIALGEWELDSSYFEDCHPFDEVNYVLEGTLVVDCDGEEVEVGPGESVQVLAGSPARYRAEGRARMVYAYGPNPTGQASRVISGGAL